MDFLPRTKRKITKQISVEKQEIVVSFNAEDVKLALLSIFGSTRIGPEGYFIPKDCEINLLDSVELIFYVDK